ncbi:serine protease 56-like [Anopheles cruzii]|uniref:serine protease 56-like n=1 Tax=Anopheles cruzii TaxID=68878 RepID=UPI0022EC5E7B|nr:serine protease 56-like [Anopheles cruzii]
MTQNSTLARIVGGVDVSPPNKYSWTALLQYYGQNRGSGTLINDRTVISSATIISGMVVSIQIAVIFDAFDASASDESTRRPFAVARARVHPQYTAQNPFRNNIGLLQLVVPITISPSLMPICLPNNYDSFAGTEAVLAGWGASDQDGSPWQTLRETTIPLYSVDECQLAYPNATEDNICGGVFYPVPADQHKALCDVSTNILHNVMLLDDT